MTIITLASTSNKITKVKRPREVGFSILFFGFCFVLGPFLFFMLLSSPKSFFITKNLVITYELSTIEGFCHKEKDFATILVFLSYYYSSRKIKK